MDVIANDFIAKMEGLKKLVLLSINYNEIAEQQRQIEEDMKVMRLHLEQQQMLEHSKSKPVVMSESSKMIYSKSDFAVEDRKPVVMSESSKSKSDFAVDVRKPDIMSEASKSVPAKDSRSAVLEALLSIEEPTTAKRVSTLSGMDNLNETKAILKTLVDEMIVVKVKTQDGVEKKRVVSKYRLINPTDPHLAEMLKQMSPASEQRPAAKKHTIDAEERQGAVKKARLSPPAEEEDMVLTLEPTLEPTMFDSDLPKVNSGLTSPLHDHKDNKKPREEKPKTSKCANCKQVGHTRPKCYELCKCGEGKSHQGRHCLQLAKNRKVEDDSEGTAELGDNSI